MERVLLKKAYIGFTTETSLLFCIQRRICARRFDGKVNIRIRIFLTRFLTLYSISETVKIRSKPNLKSICIHERRIRNLDPSWWFPYSVHWFLCPLHFFLCSLNFTSLIECFICFLDFFLIVIIINILNEISWDNDLVALIIDFKEIFRTKTVIFLILLRFNS